MITGSRGSCGPTSEKGAPAALAGLSTFILHRSKHDRPIRAKSMTRNN
jgi:hypothetical protein